MESDIASEVSSAGRFIGSDLAGEAASSAGRSIGPDLAVEVGSSVDGSIWHDRAGGVAGNMGLGMAITKEMEKAKAEARADERKKKARKFFTDAREESITQIRGAALYPLLHMPGSINRWFLDPKFPDPTQDAPTWGDVLVNDAYKGWPANRLKEYYEASDAGLRGSGASLPKILGGKGGGALCSDFEGDWQDLNPANIELLGKRMNGELETSRQQVWRLFREMYHGATPEVGQPSMVARWMLARRWVGSDIPGTVQYDLANVEQFNR